MSYPPSPQQPEPYGPGENPAGPFPPAGQPYAPPGQPYRPAGQQPAPGYPPPGGYPAPRRSKRTSLLVIGVIIGVLAPIALLVAVLLGHAASACGSDIGQIAQAFDQQAAGDCSTASTARTVLEVAAGVFAVGCVASIIGYRRS
jgi:hypothetical protein